MTKERIDGFGPFIDGEILVQVQAFHPDGRSLGGVIARVEPSHMGITEFWEPISHNLMWELTQSLKPNPKSEQD